jgi:hypothetical protein
MIAGFLRPVGTLIYRFEYTKLISKSKKSQETYFEIVVF